MNAYRAIVTFGTGPKHTTYVDAASKEDAAATLVGEGFFVHAMYVLEVGINATDALGDEPQRITALLAQENARAYWARSLAASHHLAIMAQLAAARHYRNARVALRIESV